MASPPKGTQRSRGTTASAVVTALSLLIVAASLSRLPGTLLPLVPAVASELLHLVAALSAGRFLVRVARAAPKGALDIIVTSTALGLALSALLTLAFATADLLHWWTPWVIDLVLLMLGVRRMPETVERLLEPLRRQEHAVLLGFRAPLFAALALAVGLAAIPPLLPPTAATGVAALALPSQASLRESLPDALAALPGASATPSQCLLIHGHLAAGAVGARLHGLALLLLLASAAFVHVERRFGGRAAGWCSLLVLTTPWIFARTARDPSAELLLLFGFLALREVSDWLIDGTGGKIALASAHGGVLLAESAEGAAILATVLLLLLVVQVLVEREGFVRPVGGVAAMLGVAVLVALPFVGLSVIADRDAATSLARRYAPEPLAAHAERIAQVAPQAGEVGPLAAAARRTLSAGPLLLAFLLLVPFIPEPSPALRHAVLGAAIGVLAWLAPQPYGTRLALVAPAAVAATVAGVSAVARRGVPGRLAGWLAAVATAASFLVLLGTGPDLGAGLRVLTGREDAASYLARELPDADLVADVATRPLPEGRTVLLVGNLTTAHYPVPVRRVAPGPEALAAALDPKTTDVEYVAWNARSVPASEAPALADLDVLEMHGELLLLRGPASRR